MPTITMFLFWGGFSFLIGVGVWAVVTITRMRREQAIAMTLLRTMSAKAGVTQERKP